MSWANDILCLYCEKKLPLYRKITSGQFCSVAHCQAYWKKQERLGIERLEQSHNLLHAHRSLEVIEGEPEVGFGGFIPFELTINRSIPAGMVVAATPLTPKMRPLYPIYIAVWPQSEELSPLREEQIPNPEKLLLLRRPSVCERTNRIAKVVGPTMTIFPSLAPLVKTRRAQTQIPAPGVGGLLPLKLVAYRGGPGLESIPAPRLSLPVPQPPSLAPIYPRTRFEPLKTIQGIPAAAARIASRPYQWAYIAAIPVLLGLALYSSNPTAAGAIPRAFEGAVNTQFKSVRRTVFDRAAVVLNEDFRAGLDNWTIRDSGATDWSFDRTGFVRPGRLALYRPSLGLRDYQMQFLGLIDKQAISWVVRAADFRNYYVVKLVVLKAGALPAIGVTRYAVIDGRADSRVKTIAAIDARPDTLYRVRMDLRGDTFLLSVQGRVVDNWTEPRLLNGGVGLFSGAGEASRIRWVEVTHQYDLLGRLCAYLAPYNFQMTNGS